MKVYIVFDPTGIWELGEPVYDTRKGAEAVVAANPPLRNAFGVYALRGVEYDVQSVTPPDPGPDPLDGFSPGLQR